MKSRPLSFPIEKTFPPTDPLAVDILRLMAGYNDIALVIEWLEEHLEEPEEFHQKMWAGGRLDLQLRLLFAMMHETLNVLVEIQKQPDFPSLEKRLDHTGQKALGFLQQIRAGQDDLGKQLLTLTRNKTTYHYDHDEFRDGLKRLLDRSDKDSTASMLFIEGNSGQEQYYFMLADAIRAEIIQGLTGAANKQYLDKLLELTRSFGTFIESLLKAYASDRGLMTDFSFKK
jgi:hypothetical protein